MKKPILVILIMAVLASLSQAQDWKVIEFPSSESITGISMVNDDTGFVVTAAGDFGLTADGGKKWLRSSSIEGVRLESLCFLDTHNGWVCGHKGRIMSTTDGGQSWIDHSWRDTLAIFFDIQMINKDTGIAVGIFADTIKSLNSIGLRTIDGGKTWIEMETMGLAYSDASYEKSNKTLYFMSMGRMNSTTDGGRKWQSIGTLEGPAARTFSIYQSTGIMAGPKGICGYSVDGGKAWYKVPRGETEHFFASTLFDTKQGFIGGFGGLMLSTKDGGRNWQTETLPKTFIILDMCSTKDAVYAAGSDGTIIYKNLKK